MAVANERLTARVLASEPVWAVSPDLPAAQAKAELQAREFDAALVADSDPARVVDQNGLGASGFVGDYARMVTTNLLVTGELNLMKTMALLADQPYLLVLDQAQLIGIITRSDVQKPAVAMVAFALILSLESALNALIEKDYGNEWFNSLNANQRAKVDAVFDARQAAGAQVRQIEAMMLPERMALVVKSSVLRAQLGAGSRRSAERLATALTRLRDFLAHGGSLLDLHGEPSLAIDDFLNLQRLASRAWEASN
jgi:hypothetical protein